MALITQNFKKLNDRLLKELKFFDPGPVKSFVFKKDPAPRFIKDLRRQIHKGKKQFEKKYQQGYINPLLRYLKQIIITLSPDHNPPNQEDKPAYVYLTLLVNAALQPAQRNVEKYLRPAQIIADDLYYSFRKSRKRLGIKGPLDQEAPPLVGFVGPLPSINGRKISDKAPMPSTFEVGQQMRTPDWLYHLADDFTVGAVVLPAGYRDNPLLFGVLGHEVGGHYVLTSEHRATVLNELEGKIYRELQKTYTRSPLNKLASLWYFWAEEAAADVCGVLNLGPSFGIGAIAWYTAIRCLSNWGKRDVLDVINVPQNPHPVPALIPYLICGAVEGLKNLEQSRKLRYIAQLEEIGKSYTLHHDVVKFPKGSNVEDTKGKVIKLPQALPLKAMQDSARLVGRYITTVKLKTLKQNDLQSLATWDDEDEDAALFVADQLKTQDSAAGIMLNGKKAKPLQLLTGGILAVTRQPSLYRCINEGLRNAFRLHRG